MCRGRGVRIDHNTHAPRGVFVRRSLHRMRCRAVYTACPDQPDRAHTRAWGGGGRDSCAAFCSNKHSALRHWSTACAPDTMTTTAAQHPPNPLTLLCLLSAPLPAPCPASCLDPGRHCGPGQERAVHVREHGPSMLLAVHVVRDPARPVLVRTAAGHLPL